MFGDKKIPAFVRSTKIGRSPPSTGGADDTQHQTENLDSDAAGAVGPQILTEEFVETPEQSEDSGRNEDGQIGTEFIIKKEGVGELLKTLQKDSAISESYDANSPIISEEKSPEKEVFRFSPARSQFLRELVQNQKITGKELKNLKSNYGKAGRPRKTLEFIQRTIGLAIELRKIVLKNHEEALKYSQHLELVRYFSEGTIETSVRL